LFPLSRRVWREEKFESEDGNGPEKRLFDKSSCPNLTGFKELLPFSDNVPDR
jgi:hypothetical protein